MDSLGYKLARDQQSMTPLQRLVLFYGYACFNAQTFEKKETRSLDELAGILPKG